jgi:pyruvate/2-oxoglutarate dehydrogenase complex dihydrolipoamide acyltransferase (E2) component
VSAGSPDTGELRALVRKVLSELLPAEVVGALSAGTADGEPAATPGALSAGTTALPAGAHGGLPTGERGVAGRPGVVQPGLAHSVREAVEAVETVGLRNDADLDAFVKRLLRLFENPKQRDALRAGRLRFRLAAAAGPGSVQPAHRVDKGAVTEAMVRQAARAGARLVLGRRAVLTPLARDRARAAGVEIERER